MLEGPPYCDFARKTLEHWCEIVTRAWALTYPQEVWSRGPNASDLERHLHGMSGRTT